MSHDRTMARASRHDRIIRTLDDNDHLTKRGGGKHTHQTEAAFRMKEESERQRGEHSGRHLEEPIGPSNSANYRGSGKGAVGAHGLGQIPKQHDLNKPARGKKLDK